MKKGLEIERHGAMKKYMSQAKIKRLSEGHGGMMLVMKNLMIRDLELNREGKEGKGGKIRSRKSFVVIWWP